MSENKPKVIEGEIIEETISLSPSGRNPKPVEVQLIPSPGPGKRLTVAQQETHNRLMKHIDTKDIEQRLLNTYAGGFVGFCAEDDDDE